MTKIDTTKWKEFKIEELFDIHPTKAYKLTNNSLFENDGDNPVIVNSSYNNGVGGYTFLNTTEEGNIITFSDTTSSDAIFFQEVDFVGYPHVQGMYPIGKYKNDWGKYSLLFFVSVFKSRANGLNYDYVNKFTRDSAKKITIKLPVDTTGNPDFSYMETYMKNLEVTVGSSLTALQSAKRSKSSKEIDTTKWKEFKIYELFDAYLSKDDIQPKNITEGDIPLVSSGKENNGIVAYITSREAKLWNSDTITVDMFGKAFHQPNKFFSVSHGRVNILVPHEKVNEYALRFIATTIEKVALTKYEFKEMCTGTKLLKDSIKLPVDENGKPDFSYMEGYMRNIEERIKMNTEYLSVV